MIRKPLDYRWRIFLGIVSISVIAFVYQSLSWRQRSINPKDTTMPGLFEIVTVGTHKICTPDIFDRIWIIEDSYATFTRLFLGLGSGVFLSFLIGVAMGCWAPVDAIFKWPVTFFGQIPPTAMLAVYLIIYNITEIPLVPTMICLGILPSLTLTIYNAAKFDVHDESIYKAYTLGASHMEVVWNVVVRQILPRVIDAVRICVGPAFVFLIAAEWANEHVGFGYRLKLQSRQSHMAVVYNYLIILALFGYFSNFALLQLRKFVSPWYGRSR